MHETYVNLLVNLGKPFKIVQFFRNAFSEIRETLAMERLLTIVDVQMGHHSSSVSTMTIIPVLAVAYQTFVFVQMVILPHNKMLA